MLLALLSCTNSTAPEMRALSELHQLHVAPDAPPLVSTQATFYAVKGKSAGVDLWYHARPGRTDSLKFVEFRMGPLSLDRRPDGSAVAQGDSVLITLTVTDATHLMIDFQPAGLTFSSIDQPTLKMFWGACADDPNYGLSLQFSIWRQEAPGQSWFKVPSFVAQATKEVDAHLGGFTGYAILY
jgi:hypothetical protein